MPRLDIYSDVICPWCYIGKQNMQAARRMLAADGIAFDVSWRPFQLNPDMPKSGLPRSAYRQAKFGSLERSRQLDAEVVAAATAVGLDINFDRISITPNTFDAHRLIAWSEPGGHQNALVDRLFAAYFTEGLDIGDPVTLATLAEQAGLDPAAVSEFLASDGLAGEIATEEQMARRAGLNAVPTFVLERHVLFSGAVAPEIFAELTGNAYRAIVGQAA